MSSQLHNSFLSATLPALDLVHNLARRMAPDPARVEDLVQDAYANAFKSWSRGHRPRKIEPWMATIVLNLGRSYWRRSSTKLEESVAEVFDPDSTVDIEDEAIAAVRRDAVHDALWQLPEEQRIAVTLMDLNGFTASEAAKIMKSPRGTILSRVHRGRKKLAVLLEKAVVLDEA